MKIAVIGPASSVMGFKALGLEVLVVQRPEDAPAVWDSLDTEEYAVIFVTEDLFEALFAQIEAFSHRTFPVVTLIPPVSGSGGAGVERLKSLVEKAIGTEMSVVEG